MPRPATRTRILTAGAGAAVAVATWSFALNPPAQVDPLGSLGRAGAATPEPAPPGPPEAFGVVGVDLPALGYSGPDLGSPLGSVFAPLPSQAIERAADVRDRLTEAAPHLRGLHQAKILLRKAADRQDHHLHAAKVAAAEAEEARVAADAALAEAIAAATAAPPPVATPAPSPDAAERPGRAGAERDAQDRGEAEHRVDPGRRCKQPAQPGEHHQAHHARLGQREKVAPVRRELGSGDGVGHGIRLWQRL